MPATRPLPRTGSISSTPGVAAERCGSPGTPSPGSSSSRCGATTLCAGSFRLAVDEVPALIDILRAGLDQTYATALAEHADRLTRGA